MGEAAAQLRYVELVVPGDWKGEPSTLDDLAAAYEGIPSRMRSSDVVQTRLTVELWAHADEEPRATGAVDFKAPGVKDIEVYPGHVGEEHIHATSIELSAKDLIFRLTSVKVASDPKVAANLLGAFGKPSPLPTAICRSDPAKCFFAVLNPSSPTAPGSGIPFICTEGGLALLKRFAYVDAITEGSCILVGGLTQPAGSGDNEGIPEMTYSLTPSKVQAAMGSTYGMGPGYQYNVTLWLELEAVFADGRVTGTIKLTDYTDYSEYKSDGVWVGGGYNPNGAIPLSPPQFATITFEGTQGP